MHGHWRRDREVCGMRWPIRFKLLVGLSVVVGMMLTLMGGSFFGLRAFHDSNLKLVDQLRELGGSKDLLQAVMRLDSMDDGDLGSAQRRALETRVHGARQALKRYYTELERNSTRGNRADDGRDEFVLAFQIDDDLTAILRSLRADAAIEWLLPRTRTYLTNHPEAQLRLVGPWDQKAMLEARLARLNKAAAELPDMLHRDFLRVLEISKGRYQSSRMIVWISAGAVLAMLIGLSIVIHRWVLYPVRLLQRGVRRAARGQFDYRIDLSTGDEMQALAEAYNDMAARLGVTYADLERQIQERSRQLVQSERLASVGFLAAGVAHEINNPLAAIAFCAEAIEGRLGSLTPAGESPDVKTVRNYLQMIQEEAFRCKGITEKLLDFSRCNAIQRQRTDLVELVQGVVEMICHMGKYRSKTIQFQPREAVFAHVDPQEIKQVVLNLVVNALDSMETGGTLRIQLRNDDGLAVMNYTDDGCGMTPEILENIFEPFFTRRRVGKGTGLGLSITHRIVAQHQGEIVASSPGEGKGATFIVRLPIRPVELGEASTGVEGSSRVARIDPGESPGARAPAAARGEALSHAAS
jgi:signal transduction histidine kinase